MRWSALLIVKGSRRRARCSTCSAEITWATLARRGGKYIPLVAAPVIIRTEKSDRDVLLEVVGFDQIHKCSARPKAKKTSASAANAPWHRSTEPPQPAFSAFSPDRLQQLRNAIAPSDHARPDKPAQQGRLI